MATHVTEEMHTKICKKIAQLTKVIYTLNTKAEEQENVVENLKTNHEKAIERVMYESKNKILQIKEQSQNSIEKEKEFEKLKCLFEEAKIENLKLEEQIKTNAEAYKLNTKQIQTDYENKYLDLQNKFLERKHDYTELQDTFSQFKQSIENMKHTKETALTIHHHDELKKTKELHQLTIEQMSKDQIEAEVKFSDKIKELEKLRMNWDIESKQVAKEYEEKIKKMKDFFEKEHQLLKSSLQKETTNSWQNEKNEIIQHYNDIVSKSELINTQQKYRISFLEKSIEEKDIQIENYESNCGTLDFQIKNNLEKILDLEKLLKEREGRILELENDVKGSNENNERVNTLRKYLLEATNKLKTSEEKYISELKEKNGTIKLLERSSLDQSNNLNKLKSQLAKSEDKCERLEHDCSVNIKRHEDTKNEKNNLQVLFEKLKKQIQEYKTNAEKYAIELKNLKESHQRNIEQFEKNQKKELENVNECHAENIKHFKSESEKILKESQGQLLGEFAKNRENLLQIQSENILEKDELIGKLQVTQQKLECDIKDVRSQMEKKIEQLNKEGKEILNQLKTQLQDKEKELLKIQESKVQLKEKLENEKKKAIEKIIEECDKEKHKLIQSYDESIRSEHISKHENLIKHYDNEKQQLMERLMLESEREIQNMKYLKDEEIKDLKTQIDRKSAVVNALETDLKTTKDFHENKIKELEENILAIKCQYDKMLKQNDDKLKKSFSFEIADLKKNLLENGKQELQKQDEAFKNELNDLRTEHRFVLNALKIKYEKDRETSLKDLNDQLNQEKDSLQDFLRLQNEAGIKQLKDECEKEIINYKSELERSNHLRQKEFDVHTKKILKLSESLEESQAKVKVTLKDLQSAENEVVTIRKELELKVQEVLEVRRECNSRMRCRVEDISRDNDKIIDKMHANHMTELRSAMKEWKEKQAFLQDQLSACKIKLQEAEELYNNRPSRDEDVQHIHDLQETVLQQDVYCQKLQEEKKKYKLELVNREENFNKMFNSSPNVGFLNPIELNKKKSAKKKESISRFNGR